MGTLTERTLLRLGERLEAFRPRGAIPALMAAFRVGAPEEERKPLRDFEGALWSGAVRHLPDGSQLSRHLWLAAPNAVGAEFRSFCRDAGRFVVPILHAAGYHVGIGAVDPTTRWLWAVFELAELRLKGTVLRLVGGTIWRTAAGGTLLGEEILADPGAFARLAASAGSTRYWKLADAVESSLAALDIAQTQSEPVQTRHQTAAPPAARPRRNTRAIDVDGPLGRLEAKMRKEPMRELGSESATEATLIDRLYSLSAEDLVPLLKGVGCKTSAKTIRRAGKSAKYASWERYRRPVVPPAADVDVGPAALSDVRSRAADAVDDAVDSGHLSRRSGGRGATHIRKTAEERAAGKAADELAREAGITLPPDD